MEIAALRKMVAKMKVEEAKYTVSRYLQYLCMTTSVLRYNLQVFVGSSSDVLIN